MLIPFLDLTRQSSSLQTEIEEALLRVARSGRYILGEEVAAFERELARWSGLRDIVGVSCASDALLLSLRALGIGRGDEVVTTPFSFVATAEAIVRAGARPVFADIEPDTFNLSPEKAERELSHLTRAVLVVHLFGQMADIPALRSVAQNASVPIIEDAAQSLGALDTQGRPAGQAGLFACFSFFPSKNLGGMGDGGAVGTRSGDLAETLRSLRSHGRSGEEPGGMIGGNFRLDEIQAAVLRVKLRNVETEIEGRRAHAARLREELGNLPCVRNGDLILPAEREGGRHTYHQFVIRTPRRDRLRAHYAASGIETKIYYPTPIHLLPAYRDLGPGPGSLPEAERASRETLALPIFSGLTDRELDDLIRATRRYFEMG